MKKKDIMTLEQMREQARALCLKLANRYNAGELDAKLTAVLNKANARFHRRERLCLWAKIEKRCA